MRHSEAGVIEAGLEARLKATKPPRRSITYREAGVKQSHETQRIRIVPRAILGSMKHRRRVMPRSIDESRGSLRNGKLLSTISPPPASSHPRNLTV